VNPSRHVNPYIAGSPVTGTEMFFGREDVFSFVRRNLTGRHRDTPIVLYGQRRTGKTSVLYQMHRHLDPLYRCIFIDLHGLNLNGVENLLWGIASSIQRGLQRDHQLSVAVPDRAAFSANPQAAFETTFLDAVWSVLGEDHLVLMIDEVVRLHEEVRAGRLERDVFDYLRHLMQHFEHLNFVFSLGSGVEEMKKDYAFLFGVALYHRISFLEPGAARALITKPAQGCYRVTSDAAEKILQITSGHPYYTQLVCHCLFDQWLRDPKPQMTLTDVEAVLAEAIELGSANLTYVWEDSTPEEQATMAGMAAAMRARGCPATIDQIREVWSQAGLWLPEGEAAAAVRNLTAREVAVASDGAYSFAVDLQRLWLDKHRRLDWVKEELGEAARKWDLSAKAVRSPRGKPPHGRRPRTSARGRIFLAAFGILGLIVLIVVSFINLHTPGAVDNSSSRQASTANPGSHKVIFSEQFSNPRVGWEIVGGSGTGLMCNNGTYQIYTQRYYAFAAPKQEPVGGFSQQDLSIATAARDIEGPATDFEYGLVCRSNPQNTNAYVFAVTSGSVYIEKFVNNRLRILRSEPFNRSMQVTNQLRAVCANAGEQRAVRLGFWVNGAEVATYQDTSNPLPGGAVGLYENSYSNTRRSGAEFYNFVVIQT
jgi:AAA domain